MSEKVLEPLEMSDTEMITFIASSCKSVEWIEGYMVGWRVTLDYGKHVCGGTIEEALNKAAAYDKDHNRDY